MAVRRRKPAAKAKSASGVKRDEFFRFEGDYYRRRAGHIGVVDEILLNGQWKPVKYDGVAPATFGVKVDPSEVR